MAPRETRGAWSLGLLTSLTSLRSRNSWSDQLQTPWQFRGPETATPTVEGNRFAVDRTSLDFSDAPLGPVCESDFIAFFGDEPRGIFFGGRHQFSPFFLLGVVSLVFPVRLNKPF